MSTRQTGIAGVACFSLVVLGALIEPTFDVPATQAPATEVAAYVSENRESLLLSMFAYSLAFGAFLAFAGGLWELLERSAAFALASAAAATMILTAFAVESVLAYREPSPEAAQLLGDVTFGLLAVSGVPTAVALGAYAAVVLRARVIAGWTAWVAVVAAAAHVVIAASFLFERGFLSLEGQVITWVPVTLFGWILATSVALLRARD